MAQKTKVKELVGRGLNSYHTKALQQIKRIEKKNKEQNHKINILTGELDKDYITKTAEGSAISLDHSKEGMVYLDELQGNTLVNYCTDGSKEMTLNGDIDVEGVSVTTTEGVDNGKVDVMCEGNTLVNLMPNINTDDKYYKHTAQYDWYTSPYRTNAHKLKPSTKYTVILDILEYTLTSENAFHLSVDHNNQNAFVENIFVKSKGYYVRTLTTKAELVDTMLAPRQQIAKADDGYVKYRMILLEGDWTNKKIPSYFEGMKSVGQDDENGHKIEILSNNKNILSPVKGKKHPFFIKKGTKLVLSEKNNTPSLGGNVKLMDINGNVQWFAIDAGVTTPRYTTTNNDIYCIENALGGDLEYQVEIGTTRTPYVPYAMNKKEISLNEPLRGVDNVKDKFVKIGGKWFIERNCIGVQFKDLKYTIVHTYQKDEFPDVIGFRLMGTGVNSPIMCDKYAYTNDRIINFGQLLTNEEYINVYNSGKEFFITIKKAKLETLDIEGLMNYFSNNSLEIVGKADSTTYEPITDATLITYLDTTHISNNSIIPCNMKIKNSGYNAIIKPSTLYTVALDTNKSGTIGMNLGGVKGTTTNNVLTLTTPATLSDDSLRLYGKGIKGSKVRILEGDKTNWIPSHFEGMKSSFEDKIQEDGNYTMKILSNNKNIMDVPNINCLSKVKGCWWNLEGTNSSLYNDINKKTKLCFFAEKGKSYIITFDYKNLATIQRLEYQNQEKIISLAESNLTNGKGKLRIIGDGKVSTFRLKSQIEDGSTPTEVTNFMVIEEGVYSDKFIKNEQNKIQFSSIEPLRKWDRFVFKDGQLMIERGSRTVDLSSLIWGGYEDKNKCYKFGVQLNSAKRSSGNNANLICDTLPVRADETKDSTISIYTHAYSMELRICIRKHELSSFDRDGVAEWLSKNPTKIIYELAEPTYEEIPFELQKIILEGYENGTLFLDTNIPPTVTVTYAGETPIARATKLNKTEVSNNTADINDNILPYLMDMDYRIVMLQLATEELEGEVSMARLFGGTYEILKRDILSKRLSRQEYGYRLADYFNAGKLTEEQVRELEELR